MKLKWELTLIKKFIFFEIDANKIDLYVLLLCGRLYNIIIIHLIN